jgi:hypothetical protein
MLGIAIFAVLALVGMVRRADPPQEWPINLRIRLLRELRRS